ncbi:MAG: hypothetical protein ACI8S6_001713 [Myxococcota bacterium]|jgi:hypothetical protein
MREDMHHKLVERPRWGSRWLKHGGVKHQRQALKAARATGDFESLPQRMSSRPRRGNRKSSSENFAPLLSFLHTRVGTSWDRVYSEIRANISPSSVIDMHIMQHLYDFVRQVVWIDAERRIWHSHWGTPRELLDDRSTFYVHPRTGLLSRPTRRRRPRGQPVPRSPHVILGDGELGVKLGEHWFLVETQPMPEWREPPLRDVVLGEQAGYANADRRAALYGSPDLVGVSRRQLSRKVIRRALAWAQAR